MHDMQEYACDLLDGNAYYYLNHGRPELAATMSRLYDDVGKLSSESKPLAVLDKTCRSGFWSESVAAVLSAYHANCVGPDTSAVDYIHSLTAIHNIAAIQNPR
jgi:hypothetical protein